MARVDTYLPNLRPLVCIPIGVWKAMHACTRDMQAPILERGRGKVLRFHITQREA